MTGADRECLWVLRAQSGDTGALDALLKAYQAPLHGYLRSLVHDPHLALDVLQDVFVLVIRKLRWLHDARAFRPWVYRIASRAAFRRLQKERRHAQRLGPDAVSEAVAVAPAEQEVDPELLERLPGLLEQVSPASRAVLSLHYLQEMSLQEVADVLGIPLGTTKARLAYGLANLRRKLRRPSPPPGGAPGRVDC